MHFSKVFLSNLSFRSLSFICLGCILNFSCIDQSDPIIVFINEQGEEISNEVYLLEVDSSVVNFGLQLNVTDNRELGDVIITKTVNGEIPEPNKQDFRLFQLDRGIIYKYLWEVTLTKELAEEVSLPLYSKGDIVVFKVEASDAKGNETNNSIQVILE